MDFDSRFSSYRTMTEDGLKAYFSDDIDIAEPLKSAMAYSLFVGGKRLRPVMMLSGSELLGGNVNEALALACAMEMFHTASLIFDDLPAMDDDDLRRGKPTNHTVFGEGMAICAAHGLINYGFEIALDHAYKYPRNIKAHLAAIRCVTNAAGPYGMVGGQAMDLTCEGVEGVGAAELSFIHHNKTAKLIIASLVGGLLFQSPSEAQVQAMTQFGSDIGLAFQIVDDLLDIRGDSVKLGKPTGSDAKSQKLTYPGLHGIEVSEAKVDELMVSAHDSLKVFGEGAWFLDALSKKLAKRES